MKFKLLIGFVVFAFLQSVAQTSFPVIADKVCVDYSGNIYLISEGKITKTDINGKNGPDYSLPGNTGISHCDVVNPLEILLYNKDFNRIYSLNNQLSLIGNPLQLDEMGLNNVETVCSSSMGGFWVFNNDNRQISHYSISTGKPIQSVSLSSISAYKNDLPLMMVETNVCLLVAFPQSGLFLFSHNGAFIKQIDLKNAHLSYAQGSTAILTDNTQIILFNVGNFSADTLVFKDSIKDAFLNKESLIIFDGKKISFELIPANQ